MNVEKLLNQTHQRAGLLAVISGIVQTCDDKNTVKSIAATLKRIFSDHPVDDFIEKATLMAIDDALETDKESFEEQMKGMMDKINDILKDSSN